MAEDSTENLRRLLKSDLATSPKKDVSYTAVDLENMMQSLNNDFASVSNGNEVKNIPTLDRPVISQFSETTSSRSSNSWNSRWKQTAVADSDDSFMHSSDRLYEGNSEPSISSSYDKDTLDHTVLKFGADYVLRGKLGKYLSAVPIVQEGVAAGPVGIGGRNLVPHTLQISGQGIGEPIDCLNFMSIDKKDGKEDLGPMRYGATVVIKSPAAMERLLGVKEGKLGFYRHLIGNNEKFQILKANSAAYSAHNMNSTSSGAGAGVVGGGGGIRGHEEPGSRGKYVRIGDVVMIQTANELQVLSLHEGIEGVEASLEFKDRTRLGAELWQVEQFGAVPLPVWYYNRPYLNGTFLAVTPIARAPASDVEGRTFPKSTSMFTRGETPAPTPPLSSMSISAQHLVLLRDLLLVLAGVEGQHIRVAAAKNGNPTADPLRPEDRFSTARARRTQGGGNALKVTDISLVIDVDSADRSTVSQVMLLLPIAESAVRVREFIRLHSRYEFGFVSHALCAALKKIMREFDVLIAQLEHKHQQNDLSLQKMMFLLQPSKTTLMMLDRLCQRLLNTVGGHMLDVLHGCMLEQGDNQARDLHHHLLMEASKPFLKMLSLWIFRGELADPYKEFMIFEDSSVSKEALEQDFNAQYWETRYTLREEHIPRVLRSHAVKALTAGKYLHVVRGCLAGSTNSSSNRYNNNYNTVVVVDTSKYTNHQSSNCSRDMQWQLPEEKTLHLSLELSDNTLSREIEQAYLFSSRALLKLLEVNHKLSSHVTSLRRFFLLEHGDFYIQFMDTAEEDLRKEVGDVVLNRIQQLLQMAIQTSTLSTDPNRDDLTCSMATHNLIQHLNLIQSAGDRSAASEYVNAGHGLKGNEAFTLDYKVGWPLSIVLSNRAITKYQLLSRLLYFSKHVERRVLASWMGHQDTKGLDVRFCMSASYCLRHRMLHFLQNFVYYMTFEVIHPRSHELTEAMRYAEDMDEVMELHERFLDSCLNECLLASQELLRTLTKLMTTCQLFADHMMKFAADEEEENREVIQALNDSKAIAGATVESLTEAQQKADRALKRAESSNSMRGGHNAVPPPPPQKSKTAQLQAQRNEVRAEFIRSETSHESFTRTLSKFSKTFDEQFKDFLGKLWSDSYRNHGQLTNLCVRLDYNGYYSDKFARQQQAPEAAGL